MKRRCLRCGGAFDLSGKRGPRKHCSGCQKELKARMGADAKLTAPNLRKIKDSWKRFAEGVSPLQTASMTAPDGSKVSLTSSAREKRTNEWAYWRANITELKRLNKLSDERFSAVCGFSEPIDGRKVPADIRAGLNSHIPLTRLERLPDARDPDCVQADIWPSPWGYRVRVHVEGEKELEPLGSGWRIVIVELDGDQVHLHHDGSTATMKREAFKDFLIANKRARKKLGTYEPWHGSDNSESPHVPIPMMTDAEGDAFLKKLSARKVPDDMPDMPAFLRRKARLRLVVDNQPKQEETEAA